MPYFPVKPTEAKKGAQHRSTKHKTAIIKAYEKEGEYNSQELVKAYK